MLRNKTVTDSELIKRLLKTAILLLLAVVLFWKAAQYKNGLAASDPFLSIYLENGITEKRAEEIQYQNEIDSLPYVFTFWGEKRNLTIRNPEFFREAKIDLITICGGTELVLPEAVFLDVNDKSGCLLDEKTAYALFGDRDARNQAIRLQNKTYFIRGILKDSGRVLAIQSSGSADTVLDTMTVMRRDEIKSATMNNVMNIFGLQGQTMDFDTLNDITGFLLLAVPAVTAGYLLLQMGKYKKECMNPGALRSNNESIIEAFFKKYPRQYWAWALLQIGSILLISCLIFHHFTVTGEYIPTKWSDFSFWTNLILERKEGVEFLFRMPKRNPEMNYYVSFLKANLYNLLSLFFVIMVIWETKLLELYGRRE